MSSDIFVIYQIDLYFIRYQPCSFLPCHLIAALIKNQVCAALGLWEKAVESHQPILINIEKRGFACRSYEYQIQHGFMITADNYGTGYSGTATRGMGEEAIRKKMESINPDKFKIRKFGVSDVIGLTAVIIKPC